MSSSAWTGESGLWNTPSLWSAGVPTSLMDADFGGTAADTVTFTGSATIAAILGTDSFASFDMASGLLAAGGWSWDGAFTQSGGTLSLAGTAPLFAGSATQSGGTLILSSALGYGVSFLHGLQQSGGIIEIAAGTLALSGSSLLGGTLEGPGALLVGAADTLTIGAGGVIGAGRLELAAGGLLTFATNAAAFTITGDLALAAGATLAAANGIVTLAAGTAGTLAGTLTIGTLAIAGAYDLGGLALTGTSDVLITGAAALDTDPAALGAAGTLAVGPGGVLALLDPGTLAGTGTALVSLAGALDEPGAGAFTIAAPNVTLGGDVSLAGVLALTGGTAALLGSIAGAGTFVLGANETGILARGLLDETGLAIAAGGTLDVTAANLFDGALSAGGLIETGTLFTLGTAATGTLGGALIGGGTLALDGALVLAADVLGATLLVSGAAAAAPGASIGTAGRLSIAATGTLDLSDAGTLAAASLINAGLLTESGTASLTGTLTTTGTLDIAAGMLSLGAGMDSLGGSIAGAGTLALAGLATLAAGAALDVAALSLAGGTLVLGQSLAYYGRFSGDGTIATDGAALNLQQGQVAGLITGGGTLQTAGPVDEGAGNAITLAGSGTTLLDSVMFTADGAGLVLGAATDSTSLAIATGATFAITDAAAITSGEATAIVTNAGIITMEATNPLGPGATIAVATLINTGTIIDDTGALTLAAALTDTGLVEVLDALTVTGAVGGAGDGFLIEAGATLRLDAALAAGQAVDFFDPGGTLALADEAGFAGTIENFGAGDAIDLLGLAVTALTYVNGTIALLGITAGVTVTLAGLDAPGLTGPDIALVADGAGGTLLQYDTGGHINAPVGTAATSATWNQPETGNAAAGANWLSGATPAAGALLTFPSAATPYEAVFDESYTAYGIIAAAGTTLAVTGGDLAVTNTLVAGTIIIDAGTLDAVANPTGDAIAALSLAGGALQADAGALTIGTGLGTLAGTLEGDGEIVLGGSDILGPGADIVVATLALTGTTSLAGNLFVLGASFSNTGALALGADDLLLGFLTTGELAGRITGTGTITTADYVALDGTFGATLLVEGEAAGAGPERLTGAISIAPGALLVDPDITGTGTLANAGLLSAGPGAPSLTVAAFTNSGTISLGPGTLALDAGNALLGGTLEGPGELALAGTITLAAGANISLATLALTAGGSLSVASLSLAGALVDTGGLITAGTLLAANTENALAGTLGAGTIQLGGGTLGALGALALTGSGTLLDLAGATDLTGGLSLGAATSLSLAAGATLALAGALTGAGALGNAGLLSDTGIAPVTLAPGSFANSGTLAIGANATVALATGGSLAGTIDGAGTLLLAAASPLTLGNLSLGIENLTLTRGSVGLGGATTIGNDFALAGATLGLAGQTLDLTGAGTLTGTLTGGGAVILGGAFTAGTLTAGATALDIIGTLAATAPLGAAGLIGIAAGATLALDAGTALGGAGATLLNDGLVEKIADDQTATLTAASLANNGTIAAEAGTLAIAGTLANDGTLIAAGLGAVAVGGLAGSGEVAIGPAAVTVSGAVAAGQTIAFSGPFGTLTLDDPALFAGTITGTLNADIIDLPGLAPASLTGETLAGDMLTLATSTGSLTFALAGAANFSQPLIIGTDGGAGTEIAMACFVTGTRIATPAGPRLVEDLRPGDLVCTGAAALQAEPIVWTGRRRLTFSPGKPAATRPVRVLAGAFGPGAPARDLRLSPNHAIAIDGVLIEAAALVNGATIRRERDTPAVTYHHIELARHGLLRAEGLAVESYRDTGNRAEFADSAGTPAPRQPPCLPLCRGGPALAAARASLLDGALRLGFTRTHQPDLTARAGARRLRPLPQPGWHFALPPALATIELLSPTACPAELAAGPADPRTLGAALASVTLHTPRRAIPIDLAARQHTGLYECEPTLCWTNGHATLALPPYAGPALLAIRLAGAVERWEVGA
jgi:hypothetical protein